MELDRPNGLTTNMRARPRASGDCAPSTNTDATTSDRPATPLREAARARRSHTELSARDFLELAITAGTVVGVVLFLPTRVALGAFYGRFGLTPEEAGVTYTESVTSVTVVLTFLATCVVLVVWVAVYLLDSFPVLERPARAADRISDAYLALFQPRPAAYTILVAALVTILSMGVGIAASATSPRSLVQPVAVWVCVAAIIVVAVASAALAAGAVSRSVWGFVTKMWSARSDEEGVDDARRSLQLISGLAATGLLLAVAWSTGYVAGGRARDGKTVPTHLLGLRLAHHADESIVEYAGTRMCGIYLGTSQGQILTWNVASHTLLRLPADATTVTRTSSCN